MEIDIQTKTTSSLSYLIGKKSYFTEQNSWTGLSSEIRNINLVDAGWTLLTPVNSGKYYISSHNGLIYFFNGEVFKLNNGVLESISSGLNPNAKYSAYRDEFYYCSSTSQYVDGVSVYTPIFLRYSNNGSGNYNYSQITDGSTSFANAAVFGSGTWTTQKDTSHGSLSWVLKIGSSTGEGPYYVAAIYYGGNSSSSGTYYQLCGTRVVYSTNGSSWSGTTIYNQSLTSSSSYRSVPYNFYSSSANGKYICTGSYTTGLNVNDGLSYFSNPSSITKIDNSVLVDDYGFDTNECIKYTGSIYYGTGKPWSSSYNKVMKSSDGFNYTATTNSYPALVNRFIEYCNGTYYCMLSDSLYSSTNLESYTQLLVPANIKSWVGIHDSKIYVVTNEGLFYKPVSELQPIS